MSSNIPSFSSTLKNQSFPDNVDSSEKKTNGRKAKISCDDQDRLKKIVEFAFGKNFPLAKEEAQAIQNETMREFGLALATPQPFSNVQKSIKFSSLIQDRSFVDSIYQLDSPTKFIE